MKEPLSRRSQSICSSQTTQRQAINKASQLINVLMQQLSEEKNKYKSLQDLYFTLHYEHQQLKFTLNAKQTKIEQQKQHIKIQQKKIKQLHLQIAQLLKTNQILKQGINKNKIKNKSLEEQNQYLIKKSCILNTNNSMKIVSQKLNINEKQKIMECTQSTGLQHLKTYQNQQIHIPLKNGYDRLINTETKPNRRKHKSQIIQHQLKKGLKRTLHF